MWQILQWKTEFAATPKKGSFEKNEEQEIENQFEKKSKKRKYLFLCVKTTGHYVIFGVSIITFQYLFFQYVVFEYKPLSIDEIKYYVYNYLLTN